MKRWGEEHGVRFYLVAITKEPQGRQLAVIDPTGYTKAQLAKAKKLIMEREDVAEIKVLGRWSFPPFGSD